MRTPISFACGGPIAGSVPTMPELLDLQQVRAGTSGRKRLLSVHAHPDDEASKGAGTVRRHGPSGAVYLIAQGVPVKFEVDGLCRYDPGSDRWSREEFTRVDKTVGAGVVAELTDRAGLYWVRWKEDGRRFASLAAAGPMLCNDVSLAPPSRPGRIATCIPQQDSARAAYVPDPSSQCGQ